MVIVCHEKLEIRMPVTNKIAGIIIILLQPSKGLNWLMKQRTTRPMIVRKVIQVACALDDAITINKIYALEVKGEQPQGRSLRPKSQLKHVTICVLNTNVP